jgi:hypothetical protein
MSVETMAIESRLQYNRAKRQAKRQDLLARLRGKSNDLLPYEAIAYLLKNFEHTQLTEQRFVELDKIVGSAGRHQQFTREFMPREGISYDRWAGINSALLGASGVPPIEVYQLGEVYFVADGNHRVSVARANGLREIDAYVTILPVDPGLAPGDTLDDAIIKVECLQFLAQTRLDERCGELDISFTKPGGFPKLIQHIYAYSELLALASPDGLAPAFPLAARRWYDEVYLPVLAAIGARRLTRRFRGATDADTYVWLVSEVVPLAELTAGDSPAQAVDRALADAPGTFTTRLVHLVMRLTGSGPREVAPQSGGQPG